MSNETQERLERAYRVKFDTDPTEEERSQIEQAVNEMEEGNSFSWEEREGEKVLVSHEGSVPSLNEHLAADLRVIHAEAETQLKQASHNDLVAKLNPRQQRFCQLVASGMMQSRAYEIAGYKTKDARNSACAASILARYPHVSRYLRSLKETAGKADVLSLIEKRNFLAESVRTPVGEIDENHPLAQEVTIKSSTDKDGNTYTEKKVKMVGKLEALKLDAQLAGELNEKSVVQVGVSFEMLGDGMEPIDITPSLVNENALEIPQE